MRDLSISPARAQERLPGAPLHVWRAPGAPPWCEIHREGDDAYRMRFPGLADFLVFADGRVQCVPAPGTDEPTLQHLYLNQVVPASLSQRHRPVFHASCMAIDDAAVAFLGISGRGKSTLATHLGLQGHALVTDDGLELELRDGEYFAVPNTPSVRLWHDSRKMLLPDAVAAPGVSFTPKERLPSEGVIPFAPRPLPLRRAYFLGNGSAETVTISPLPMREAHMAWVEHSFMLDVRDKARMASHFEQVTRIVQLGLAYTLDYPRRYDVLPSVAEALREHLRQAQAA